ncbi:MAG: hypothetical protein RI906_1990 [Pseudomonadota bacterium]
MPGADESTPGVLLHPDDRQIAFDALHKLRNSQRDSHEVTVRLKQADGSYRWFFARAKELRDSSGDTGLVLVTHFDVHDKVLLERERDEQKQALAALRNESRFKAISESSLDLITILDRHGVIVFRNAAALAFADKSDLGEPIGNLIHPDDRDRIRRQLMDVVRTGGVARDRVKLLGHDGRVITSDAIAVPLRLSNGDVDGVLITHRDITEQLAREEKDKQAAIAAARNEADQQLGALLGKSLIGVVKSDLQGIIQDVNPAICAMSGYTREQVLGRSLLDFADPEHHAAMRETLEAISRGEASRETAIRAVRHADGSTFWTAGHTEPVRNVQGDVVGKVRFVIDVTPQMLAERALAESEAKYRLITENQTEFVQLWNADGTLVFDSLSLLRLRHEDHMIDRVMADPETTLIHPDDRERLCELWGDMVATGRQTRYDARWVLPSGEMRWVEASGRAILGPDGQVDKILTVNRDITDRKLAEQQREQARFANEAKSQFLAKVSHELRTPLNALTGYGYLLGKTGLDTRQSAYLEQITASSQQLLGLISDVLDLARIEAGQQSVTPAPFTLGALLDSALDVVRPAAQASGIELVCDDTRHLPQQLVGDEGLIKQALLNYLSNAVKFTERGQVRLQVRALADGPATGGSSHLRFEVHDTGAGIAPDRLGELLQPFAQLRADKRGTGLGLDITRRIVELMGGEVGVHSTLGQGSCFWFWVPLELEHLPSAQAPTAQPLTPQAAEESPGELAVQALSARHAGKPILVAEDDMINQALMRLMLERAGLEVAIAGDGEQALQMARAGHYAAVLMDLQMPQMDGIEATRATRQLPGWQQVPVAALTADVFTETREACLAAGMSEFLGKPVDANKLYPWLLRVLDAEQAH